MLLFLYWLLRWDKCFLVTAILGTFEDICLQHSCCCFSVKCQWVHYTKDLMVISSTEVFFCSRLEGTFFTMWGLFILQWLNLVLHKLIFWKMTFNQHYSYANKSVSNRRMFYYASFYPIAATACCCWIILKVHQSAHYLEVELHVFTIKRWTYLTKLLPITHPGASIKPSIKTNRWVHEITKKQQPNLNSWAPSSTCYNDKTSLCHFVVLYIVIEYWKLALMLICFWEWWWEPSIFSVWFQTNFLEFSLCLQLLVLLSSWHLNASS